MFKNLESLLYDLGTNNAYRRKINGLQSIALLPAIPFHTGVSTFRGRFMSMAAFFWIAGIWILEVFWLFLRRAIRKVVGWLGFTLITHEIFVFSKLTLLPYVCALIPAACALLIILLGITQTAAGKFIWSRIFVSVGATS